MLNVARNSSSFLPNSASMKNEVGYHVTPGYSTFAALDSILYPKSYKMTARRACNSNIGRVVTCLSIKTIPAFKLKRVSSTQEKITSVLYRSPDRYSA